MNVVSITIDNKRAELQKKIFEACGLDIPRFFYGSHFKDYDGHTNCTISHTNVIRMANFLNWDGVLIFEDDAYPCINCKKKLEDSIKNMPNDANILVLGWNLNRNTSFSNSYNLAAIDKTIDIWGSHSYFIVKNAYREYLKFYDDVSNHSDWIFSRMNGVYYTKEPLFIQYCKNSSMNDHNGYIYNRESLKDPPNGFERIENILKCK